MLESYENDHHTGMNIQNMARLLFDFTSGYPVLVSWLCKLIDERIPGSTEFPDKTSAWTTQGCLEAVKILPEEKSPLFESLTGKLSDYPELKKLSICYYSRGSGSHTIQMIRPLMPPLCLGP